jgi:mono/diheme cytochrome c family protein
LFIPRVVRIAALALPFCCALVGCGNGLDEYPIDLRYPLRTDPLVVGRPSATPAHPDAPGQLDKHIDAVATLDGGKLLDPAKLDRKDATTLRRALWDQFGSPARPSVVPDIQEESPEIQKAVRDLKLDRGTLARGSALYRRHCLHCHGLSGDGRGPTGPWINPHPRDYRQGVFKFISTSKEVSERKPRRIDLIRLVSRGIDDTSMPAFGLLPENEIEAIISYVIHLSLRGQVEYDTMRTLLTSGPDNLEPPGEIGDHVAGRTELFLKRWAESSGKDPLAAPAYPYTDDPKTGTPPADSIVRGYQIFTDSKGSGSCIGCHYDFGRQVPFRYDDWGTLVRPANLTAGHYRGGRRPIDLYWRLAGGIPPSGMPAADLSKKKADGSEDADATAKAYWDLVNFVQALPYPRMLPAEVRDKVYPPPGKGKEKQHAQAR